MSTHSFLIALGTGAALIAFWFAVRFPERAPENLQRLLIHVAIVMAAGWLFAVVLPVLIYTFLAGAWVLQMVHETFSRFKK